MADEERLKEYREKRHFDRTAEPGGTQKVSRSTKAGGSRFVIQKHKASTMHYDFRLEVDGVLKSWAVPKGPSTDPGDKRLAVPTEDHPLEYIDFEGNIPEPEYGAGTVIVWDTGTYRNLKDTPTAKAIAQGQTEVWLEGRKLQGGYALVRIGEGEKKRWLLIKMNDEKADARRNPISSEPASVISGLTIEQMAAKAKDGK